MTTTAIETLETHLQGLLGEAVDAKRRFKLRTALQLVVFIRESHDVALETLEGADLDPALGDQLRQLGYLE